MTINLKKEYQWNWEAKFAKATDIKKVVAELKEIEDANGKIDSGLIVKHSKNKKSVLHSYFEWNNQKAAHKWRLNQATQLLCHIEVKTISDGQPKIMRAFEITKVSNGFTNTLPEYSSDGNNALLLSSCIGDLRRVRNKLHGHEIESPIKHIDKAIDLLLKEQPELAELEASEA